jgi:hypothetical protein
MSDLEVLDVGVDRRAGPSRRVRLVLLVGALVVAGTALVVDHQLRVREDRAVADCAGEVSSAVDESGRRIQATYEYVRASFGLVSSRDLSDGLYLLIAKSARHAGGELAAARGTCASIAVLPLHTDLRDRRDRCVEVLDAQQATLADLALDGEKVMEWMEAPGSC